MPTIIRRTGKDGQLGFRARVRLCAMYARLSISHKNKRAPSGIEAP